MRRYAEPAEPISADLFDWAEAPVPEPADGEFLVQADYLATGPAQRAYLETRTVYFLGEPLPLGEVMRGRGIGRVVRSRHPDYAEGDVFVGSLGWQDYSLQRPHGKDFVFSTRKIAAPLEPLSLHLGILGQAGGTAYFGLTEGGRIRPGDNVLISAAAGGVGSCAGQIARLQGANTVTGLAGTDEKCAWLTDTLGFSAAINYKTADVPQELSRLFPAGIDLYFDNVGGTLLENVLDHLAIGARIALSGYISNQYSPTGSMGPANYHNLIFKRASMRGFVYFDYWERYAEAEAFLRDGYLAGKLVSTEDVDEGLQRMPAAAQSLFSGSNTGVKLCRVRAES